ncbi:hypothetical protein [Candidatus Competibacter phosphatis]|uniref:hypothetical protein n=1 Tax=Candidatus Competibacter phosphatis TaxID=221280 RepID=UPI0028A5BA99|nr:hypothetical protein [Candidatus Competibacter phosphatis]
MNPHRKAKSSSRYGQRFEPIPLVVNSPAPIIAGIVFFGVIHAYLFRWLSSSWTGGIVSQGLQFATLVFLMTFFVFGNFFTPFNLFGEPLHLIALELLFWVCIALADGLAISAIIGEKASNKAN